MQGKVRKIWYEYLVFPYLDFLEALWPKVVASIKVFINEALK